MILIAHRGNIDGPNIELENHPDYIVSAIKKDFDVEIDAWFINGRWFLGHDKPQYNINFNFFVENSHRLWIHCKDYIMLQVLIPHSKNLNFFYHTDEDYVLTSKKLYLGVSWKNGY